MKPRAAALSIILAPTLLFVPVPSPGQQPAKVYRIGYLATGAPAPTDQTPQGCPIQGSARWQAFMEGLQERGYVPGQNLLIECRWSEARAERAPALAAELVSLQPDLIVTGGYSPNIAAAKQATGTIPLLMVTAVDPVGRGFVASLAHPGGNLTGITETVGVQTLGKQFQLLKEAVPKATRVADLTYRQPTAVPPNPAWGMESEAAARAIGLTLQLYPLQAPEELEGAFTAMTQARAEALLVESTAFSQFHLQRIVNLAAKSRLPAMYSHRDFVEAGGLMSYWASEPPIWRRAGAYVDKILKGTKPADLPVEQPTKFDLVINLKTAKALGLTIPRTLLIQADEVIQ